MTSSRFTYNLDWKIWAFGVTLDFHFRVYDFGFGPLTISYDGGEF